jgi:uncharacterized protein involved in exopolysaccharide biosynthesis
MQDAGTAERDQYLSIAGLLAQVRVWPRTFILTLALTVAAIITYSYLKTPVYRGVVKAMPRENDAMSGGLQSVLGQFGGLAAMAGLSTGSVNEQESLALLKSRALFTQFASEQKLLPLLFPDNWDPAAGRWRTDAAHTPTMDDAWSMFDGSIRRVSDDPKTQIITLDVTWRDRQRAADWANELVRLANEQLRQRALRESAASISSYQEQAARTDIVELRQSIYKLIEVQVNRSVVAKSRLDYALTVIDPAVVPDARRYVSPRRFLMRVISVPLGLFVAVGAVVFAGIAKKILVAMQRTH